MSEKLTFEMALNALDDVIKALSEGDVPLEKAIEQYQKGLEMANFCHQALKAVEGELKVLTDEGLMPFELGE